MSEVKNEEYYLYKRSRSAAIVIRDGRILMERVQYFGREFYTVPGGGIEEGESPEEAVLRELWEECGLKGTIVRKLAVQYKYDGSAEYSYEVSIPEDAKPVLGYDPEAPLDQPPLKEVLWMSLDEISERDRAFLWFYGLITVDKFFNELRSWKDEISYPGREENPKNDIM